MSDAEPASDGAITTATAARLAPRQRSVGIWLTAGGTGAGVGALFAVIAGWAGWGAFSAALTLLSNVAMAGAAVAAFGLWRKQVRGAKDYETAIKVLRTVLAVATALRRSVRTPEDVNLLAEVEKANDAVSESIIDVRVLDESEAPVISAVWHLANDWAITAREAELPSHSRAWDWKALRRGDATAARAFRSALDEYVADVRAWAEHYVGRRS